MTANNAKKGCWVCLSASFLVTIAGFEDTVALTPREAILVRVMFELPTFIVTVGNLVMLIIRADAVVDDAFTEMLIVDDLEVTLLVLLPGTIVIADNALEAFTLPALEPEDTAAVLWLILILCQDPLMSPYEYDDAGL